MMAAAEEKILVAKIVAPHGVDGRVSAESYSDNPRRFTADASLFDEKGHIYTLLAASTHKGRLLLTIEGITSREAADTLRGQQLFALPDEQPLPEGVYYHYQLLGLSVLEQGQRIGTLTDIRDCGAHDLYTVRRDDGSETLIPAVRAFIKGVDLEQGVMQVELPEGL